MDTETVEKHLSVKVIKRDFDSFTVEHQKELLKNYNLIIRDFVKPQKEIISLKDYLKSFENLTKERRKIYFWGIPIRLSNQQYMLLSLLLYEQEISQSDFDDLVKNNIRKTINDFNRKFKKVIKDFAKSHDCTFYDKKTKTFTQLYESAFKDLIAYKSDYDKGYKLLTNYSLEKKKQKLLTKPVQLELSFPQFI